MEFEFGEVPKTNSVPDFMKSNEVSTHCILMKLKKLRDLNPDVLNCFPEDDREEATLVMIELKSCIINTRTCITRRRAAS
ncbi:hypothetical protein JTE90_016057 [Oedothorax gibbosus]|uniref:Uncharacterized protein n=1 Tax=Oedothorax gibbosus TaxID=931172 RepID=A0AAV6TJC5_9ARAC|nr:hypothetical protein JTE90_016057 [Oedothorax gibbosus]